MDAVLSSTDWLRKQAGSTEYAAPVVSTGSTLSIASCSPPANRHQRRDIQ